MEVLYKRVLFKISGESLKGQTSVIDFDKALKISEKIKMCQEFGVAIGIVVGGGNIWRGRDNDSKMDRVVADQIGMMATIQNALAIENALKEVGSIPRAMSAIAMNTIAEPFCQKRMTAHLDSGKIVIFGGGTGNPYCSTDYAAALRAAEMQADVLVKFTTVPGIYDKDPRKHKDAKMFEEITFDEVIKRKLNVMDQTAFTFCQDNNIPIRVLSMDPSDIIVEVVKTKGKKIGTIVTF